MAVGSVKRPRSLARRWTLGVAAACAIVVIGVLVWRARHVPVAETRQFLTTRMVVGDAAPPAPAAPANPGTLAGRKAAARAAFAAGRYADAASDFAWVVAHDPTGPSAGPAQWNLVRSRLRSGDATGALTALRDLLARHAGWLGAQAPDLRAGAELIERGDLAGAEAALERMIAAQPESELVPLAHALLARVHWAHGDAMGMVRAFARMLGSVRDTVPAYARLGHYLGRYAEGDPGVADDFGALAETGDEGFRDIYQYMAARTLLEQGRFEATYDALEKLRRRHPDGDFTGIVDLEHAWNLFRDGRPAEALAIFERLDAQAPAARTADFDAFFDLRAELPMGIARCLAALGRNVEAAAAFERAIAADPQGMYGVENRLGLATAYERLGRYDDAAATLSAVIDAHPDEPKVWALRQQLARVERRAAADTAR
jgi:tetratricopeptide (TPR) repeat protein